MELFDLCKNDRQPLNKTINRGEPTPDGCCRLVVPICIFGSNGEMLIQQRQPFMGSWTAFLHSGMKSVHPGKSY